MKHAKVPYIKPIIFTSEGFAKIKKQKTELEAKRVEVLERLVRAREMGDLSENSAYHGAKLEIGSIDRRLRQIKIQLKFGKVSQKGNSGEVGIGSKVIISDGGQKINLEIVGDYEADPAKGKISRQSPIGSAVFGKMVGDEIKVLLPDKVLKYKILEIS